MDTTGRTTGAACALGVRVSETHGLGTNGPGSVSFLREAVAIATELVSERTGDQSSAPLFLVSRRPWAPNGQRTSGAGRPAVGIAGYPTPPTALNGHHSPTHTHMCQLGRGAESRSNARAGGLRAYPAAVGCPTALTASANPTHPLTKHLVSGFFTSLLPV